ncbi:MAG: hypothetical protein IIC04_13190 [Proteobacteria bacterium]|nr:hypothetical protein [Pseudomonadota bacterium]
MKIPATPRIMRALLLFLAAAALAGPASSAETSIEAFYGKYMGQGVTSGEDEFSKRDLSVHIKPAGKDKFTIHWITFTRSASGKRKEYSISFKPSDRKNVFGSAMKKNLFGKSVPLDPLKGEPYVWARIHGKTLTVHAMLITDDGGYEMQVYDRTLTEGGMDLKFSRVRDGKTLKQITSSLLKLSE